MQNSDILYMENLIAAPFNKHVQKGRTKDLVTHLILEE
jgi:hypothetical protein